MFIIKSFHIVSKIHIVEDIFSFEAKFSSVLTKEKNKILQNTMTAEGLRKEMKKVVGYLIIGLILLIICFSGFACFLSCVRGEKIHNLESLIKKFVF